jgi:hypothetical protein
MINRCRFITRCHHHCARSRPLSSVDIEERVFSMRFAELSSLTDTRARSRSNQSRARCACQRSSAARERGRYGFRRIERSRGPQGHGGHTFIMPPSTRAPRVASKLRQGTRRRRPAAHIDPHDPPQKIFNIGGTRRPPGQEFAKRCAHQKNFHIKPGGRAQRVAFRAASAPVTSSLTSSTA